METAVVQFKTYLANELVSSYGLTEADAVRAVEVSAINSLLHDDPVMVMHDSIETWANEIFHEYDRAQRK